MDHVLKIPPAPFSSLRVDSFGEIQYLCSFVGANLVFALLWSEHKVRGKGRIQDSPLQNCPSLNLFEGEQQACHITMMDRSKFYANSAAGYR